MTSLFGEGEEKNINTPYGKPSDAITIFNLKKNKVAFLSRHGKNHTISPDMINYRANIWALKELGVKRIIAFFSVGSLNQDIVLGDFVVPTQFIDFTKDRKHSFNEQKIVSLSMKEPFCPQLRQELEKQDTSIHSDCTYICIQGPRFSTRKEGVFYKNIGGDIIGMTLVPECILAAELQMCYVPICVVTDSDNFSGSSVTLKKTIHSFSMIKEKTYLTMNDLIENLLELEKNCSCEKVLEWGVLNGQII